jgi:hypothetical protein
MLAIECCEMPPPPPRATQELTDFLLIWAPAAALPDDDSVSIKATFLQLICPFTANITAPTYHPPLAACCRDLVAMAGAGGGEGDGRGAPSALYDSCCASCHNLR